MRDEDLKELFAAFGTVEECKVIMDRDSGRSKGFGFVEMTQQTEGKEAIKELDGKDIDGRNLRINVAKPKEDRPRSRERY